MATVLSTIATILGLIEPFNKKMRTILIFNFLGNLLVGLSYFFEEIPAYSGAAICGVACVQVFINYGFDVKQKKIPIWLLCIYAVAFVAVNLLSFAYWYDVLSLLAALLFVLYAAQSDAKYYRIFYISNTSLWIGYDLLAHAYKNFAVHVILFIATMTAIIIRDRKKQ